MTCTHCGVRPRHEHKNSLYCLQCRAAVRRRPPGRLTVAQARRVKQLLFKMPREEIAAEIGVSVATLKRWARDNGNIRLAFFNRYAANPALVREVTAFYEKHGRPATEERFPHLRVRSIIERYPHASRQVRWTPTQVVDLARMAGLVSMEAQAAHFDRPGAGAGSIHAAWWKKFGQGGGSVNGLAWFIARHFVRAAAAKDRVEVDFWAHRKQGRRRRTKRKVLLWIDVAKHLRSDVPDHIRAAVEALARFQRWLHGGGYARHRIIKTIRERRK
jgi:transcriptional regulator with XRE-family HTH domain